MQQTTCKLKVAKCNWNVVKLDYSHNVWGWKMKRFLRLFYCFANKVIYVLEDMRKANSISQFPQMLKNDKNMTNVQKKSLGWPQESRVRKFSQSHQMPHWRNKMQIPHFRQA